MSTNTQDKIEIMYEIGNLHQQGFESDHYISMDNTVEELYIEVKLLKGKKAKYFLDRLHQTNPERLFWLMRDIVTFNYGYFGNQNNPYESSQFNEYDGELFAKIVVATDSLDRVIRSAYALLGLQTYFTAGVKEVRAWTVKKGATAPEAAGVIHTDFEKGFIRAEVISYNDFITYNGEQKSKEAGKMRLEGKEYIVQDGDVMHFRFNV